MKFRILLLSLTLFFHHNVYAWDSNNATTTVFQLFYAVIFILFLIAFKWATDSKFIKILVITLSIGFIFLLFALGAMFTPDGHPSLFKAVGGFVLLIAFTIFYKKHN